MDNFFKIISDLSKDLGFADFGAARAERLKELEPFYENYLSEGMNAGMDYLKRNVDKRLDPSLLVEGTSSVLCFLVPYSGGGGKIASYALGENYHKVVKDRLFLILKHLSAIAPQYGTENLIGRVFVDSAPVFERIWALKSGIGFIGYNNFLISPRFGLRTFIGTILCNIPFDNIDCEELRKKKAEVPKGCGGCGRCLSACPTKALCAPFKIDARKCISYHTIESKELYDIPPVNYDGQFFGCEKCLSSCPWNKETVGWTEFETNKEYLLSLTENDWINMTQKEFDIRFTNSPLERAGLEKIKNNIAMNSGKKN